MPLSLNDNHLIQHYYLNDSVGNFICCVCCCFWVYFQMPKRKSNEGTPPQRKSGRTRTLSKRRAETDTASTPSPDLVRMITEIVGHALDRREAASEAHVLDRREAASEACAIVTPEPAEPLTQDVDVNMPGNANFHGDIAADTLQNLLMQGESREANSSQIPSFSSLSFSNTSFDQISSLMTDATRAKIIRREFFDLGQLVPKDKKAKSSQILDITCDATNGMRFTTQQKTTEITSLEMWVMAFSKYASVRVLYYSEEGMGLFRHLFLVTQLFQTYPGSKAYLEYDSAYRHHLANVPSFKWGDPLNDCYLLAQHMGLRDGQRIFRESSSHASKKYTGRHSQSSTSPAIPQGYCYQYHKRAHCYHENCQFSHTCPSCFMHRSITSTHSLSMCNGGRRTAPSQPRSSQAQPQQTRQAPPKSAPSTNTNSQK